jgi:GH24 family phage-related lysozyme (muramidase)
MLEFRALGANYSSTSFLFIKSVEKIVYIPYNDGANIATIGIGYNLRDDLIRNLVLEQITGGNVPAGLDSAIESIVDSAWNSSTITSLNSVMSSYHSTYSNVPATFVFANETQINNIFTTAIEKYEARVDAKISNIQDSFERIALLSLTYNNANLIGPKLINAIQSNNRAEAWYEIRYESNSANQSQNILEGIAKRRYYESEIFNLYKDVNNVTDDEAKNAIKMSLRHEEKISEYDSDYDHKIDNDTDNANNAYDLSLLQSGQVQTLEESLSHAKTYLLSQYANNADIHNIYVDYIPDKAT